MGQRTCRRSERGRRASRPAPAAIGASRLARRDLGRGSRGSVGAVAHILVRGIFFEGWQPSATPTWNRTKEDFVARVENDLRDDPFDDTEEAIAAVFRLLDNHISEGEITQVRNSMRKALRDLWPTR